MTTHPLDLDCLLLDGVDASRRDALVAHVKACPQCSEELDFLASQQRLFARRHVEVPVTPDFAPVAAALRAREAARAPRLGALGAVLAAAALLLQLGHPPAQVTPACDSGGMCGASWLAVSWCEPEATDAVANAEDHFRACLVATPG
jgi:hypothetical protein